MTATEAAAEMERTRRGLREAVNAEAAARAALHEVERVGRGHGERSSAPPEPYGATVYGASVYGGALPAVDAARARYEDACRNVEAWGAAFGRAYDAHRVALVRERVAVSEGRA